MIKSGMDEPPAAAGGSGTKQAKGFPERVISTDSPSSIHRATCGNELRKSRMVAVFMVRLICITDAPTSTIIGIPAREYPQIQQLHHGRDLASFAG